MSTRRMVRVLLANVEVFVAVLRAHHVIQRIDSLTHLSPGAYPILEIDTIIGLDSMDGWSGMVSLAQLSLTRNQWENR